MKQLSNGRTRVKAVLVGDSGVGKKGLMQRVCMGYSPSGYMTRMYGQDVVDLTIPVHRPPHNLNITHRVRSTESLKTDDRPGTNGKGETPSGSVDGSSTTIDIEMAIWILPVDDFPRLIDMTCNAASVVGLCYKVTDEVSLEHAIHKWYPLMKTHLPSVPFVLIGCQSDLRDTTVSEGMATTNQVPRHLPPVNPKSVTTSAREIDAVAVVETTAMEDLSTRLAFETLAWYGYHHQDHVRNDWSCIIQ
ncbi:hypothetical protein M408DRAFT_328423 [Serendipita vermifera MAFF 305830]|uniref:Uncharacterized protein n=1 Tax=Serendipita vermifera MAFF 305830 TaxID=933852 RepID=A0A0C2WUW8_SERVB|nr:hypothetical protein M408DRAFT_328423 [Serendipita vermifera MAFF 305830]